MPTGTKRSVPARARAKRRTGERAILHLTLTREPFDEIRAGIKRTEYRDNKDYWRRRLVDRTFTEIHFRNGYAKNAPFMRVEFKGMRKKGSGRGSQFAIRLGKVLEVKNWKRR